MMMKILRCIFSLSIVFILPVFFSCQNEGYTDGWFDNGSAYFCPNCMDGRYTDDTGECEKCGSVTASGAFTYCYDCAKELNVCQFCGKKRGVYLCPDK